MESTGLSQSKSKIASQLSQELVNRYHFNISQSWLDGFLDTVRDPPPPLQAIVSTANFRLLNSDFTRSLNSTPSSASFNPQNLLPPNISDVNVKQVQLQGNIPVQVLDILDLGDSKWSQIEAIERVERGEEVRGREVIRNVPIMDEDGGSTNMQRTNGPAGQTTGLTKQTTGPHKLLLQDAAGVKVWAFELAALPRLFLTITTEGGGLQIGAKVLLKSGTSVRRGMVMLEPNSATILGGRVDEWDKNWRTTRKARLADALKKENEEQQD